MNGHCVAPSKQNSKSPACTRLVKTSGSLTETGAEGANSFTFKGRIGGKRLGAGSYRPTATPNESGQAGTSQTTSFELTS